MLVEFPDRPGAGPHAVGLARLVQSTPRTSDRGLIVAVIAALAEHDRIGQAIRSLDEQSSRPDLTIVCAEAGADRIALTAKSAGADGIVVGSEHGRAGALNQVLALLLPQLRDEDSVLIMDSDSMPGPGFVAEASRRLTEGVGGAGVFIGHEGGGFVELFKSSDYGPFLRDLLRTREEELVLIGEAALFSVQTLWHVATARSAGLLPTGGTQVYNPDSENEDAELALTLVYLGYKVVAVPSV
jgi:cellulose synthase/poly-beta-1,6-N-acetylglucosamine synthase-like glycosyltransferase